MMSFHAGESPANNRHSGVVPATDFQATKTIELQLTGSLLESVCSGVCDGDWPVRWRLSSHLDLLCSMEVVARPGIVSRDQPAVARY